MLGRSILLRREILEDLINNAHELRTFGDLERLLVYEIRSQPFSAESDTLHCTVSENGTYSLRLNNEARLRSKQTSSWKMHELGSTIIVRIPKDRATTNIRNAVKHATLIRSIDYY